ncbi:MAG: gliding-motility protein MglA, partial [Longimicrobiales bacterium]
LNPASLPEFEAVAVRGDGVFDTLRAVSKLVLKSLG